MGYAFISYSTKNQAEAAAMRDLLNRNGVKTWMAPGDIPLGKKYAQVINSALQNCSCLVLMLSRDAQQSQFVAKEVERVVSHGKTIIAAQLDQIGLMNEFEFFLSDTQLIAVQKIDDSSSEARRIVEAVKALCSDSPGTERSEPEPDSALSGPAEAPGSTDPKSRKGYIISAVVFLLAVCALIISLVIRQPEVSPSLPADTQSSESRHIGSVTLLGATAGIDGYGAENLFDGNIYTKWKVAFSGEAFVEWKTDEPVRPQYFKFVSCDDSSANPGRNPGKAVLRARKDESAEWETIWEMIKAPDDKDLAVMLQDVTPAVKDSYSFYRLTVSATTGSDILQLSELDLIPAGNP